jgi:hypothetical protein
MIYLKASINLFFFLFWSAIGMPFIGIGYAYRFCESWFRAGYHFRKAIEDSNYEEGLARNINPWGC